MIKLGNLLHFCSSSTGGFTKCHRVHCCRYVSFNSLGRVTIVEKNSEDQVGGRLNEMTKSGDGDNSGFRFDTGPSLLLLPDTYRETFEGAEDYAGL